jgi:hypothetical protein
LFITECKEGREGTRQYRKGKDERRGEERRGEERSKIVDS